MMDCYQSYIYIYIYKQDFALDKLQELIYPRTKPTNQKYLLRS